MATCLERDPPPDLAAEIEEMQSWVEMIPDYSVW
jgi:hypothetical protein